MGCRPHEEEGHVDAGDDEQHLGGEQLGPVVGARGPELAVADQRLVLDGARDQHQPGDGHQDLEQEGQDGDVGEVFAARPAGRRGHGEGDEEQQNEERLRPEVGEVFAEDVQRLG
jgi:hypothetical protein